MRLQLSLLPQLHLWPPLWAVLVPLIIGAVTMPLGIGWLANRMGQRIREEGPASHQAKAGTPTAGGVLVIALIVITVLVMDRHREILPALIALFLGALFGLADDVVTVRGQSRGLKARQKILIQALIGLGLGYAFLKSGQDTQMVPVLGAWHMRWLIVPAAALAMVSASNAFNLTDGSDGLGPGVMLMVALGLALVARAGAHHQNVPLIRLLLATVGALAAFLLYNLPPARVFLGGVGDEGVGLMLAAAAISAGFLWYLPLIAFVPLIETLSVVLQVYSYRRSRRRIFRMAPLHHHFQLGGWSEWRIAISGWVVSAAAGGVSVLLAGGRS